MKRQAIDKARVRNSLPVRREPYWGAPIERGLYVGYRRLAEGGTWVARWHDDSGTHRYHAIGYMSESLDYDAAVKAAIAWRKQAGAGIDASACRTVADACLLYVEDRRRAKGESTAHDADMRFRRTVYTASVGKTSLESVRQLKLENWRDELVSKHGLSRSSANRTLTTLKAALNYATGRRYVSPERSIEWSSVKAFAGAGSRRELFLDLDQRRALLKAASGAVRDLMHAVMFTGCRAGELTGAKRSQFDHRTATLRVNGKTGTRDVPLSPPVVELFKQLAEGKLPGAYLLTRNDGKPWGHSDWDELVRDAAEQAELPPGVCLYTLRHSFITEAIMSGMTTLELARMTGTSLQMIDKHYGHLAPGAARERLAKVRLV